MSDVFSSIASTAQANPVQTALGGFGVLSDILAQQKRNAILGQYESLVNNPAAAEAKIESLTAPLNQGLIQNTENQVQGYLGERGLSESPQISESVLSQSLAPYIQQNQEQGQQQYETYLSQLLAAANGNLLPPEFDISKLLASFGGAGGTSVGSGAPTSPTGGIVNYPNSFLFGNSPSDTSEVWNENPEFAGVPDWATQ